MYFRVYHISMHHNFTTPGVSGLLNSDILVLQHFVHAEAGTHQIVVV